MAYWIYPNQDDGTKVGGGLKLCTDAFSEGDLNLLVNLLDKRSGMVDTRHPQNKTKGHYTLYISKPQLPLVRSLVIICILRWHIN